MYKWPEEAEREEEALSKEKENQPGWEHDREVVWKVSKQ